MITGGTQLYDKDNRMVDPRTNAKYVLSGLLISTNSVFEDLDLLNTKINNLAAQVSGATEVANQLNVIITYDTNNISDTTAVKRQPFANENMILPSTSAPYAWQKTVYKWGDTVVKETYSIVATALYPETQVMYCAIPGSIEGNITGPMEFVDNTSDKSNSTVKWFTYFPGIDASNIFGYMAVRHRDAGQDWPNSGEWHVGLFAQYPIS